MKTTQSEFRAALFDPEQNVPHSLVDADTRPAGKRFDVYRNNVILSLIDALRSSFPVIQKMLGTETFTNLAGLYVRAHPPSDPRMMLFGTSFPEFLERFEPLQHLGYLADVARLELAQRHSYHAADAPPIDPSVFAELAPEALASAVITFAPPVRLVRAPWPILDIWHFNMTEGAPQPSAHAQDVLITRLEFDPQMHALPEGGGDLIAALMSGAALGDALDKVQLDHPEFDFSALLGLLLQTGALSALIPQN